MLCKLESLTFDVITEFREFTSENKYYAYRYLKLADFDNIVLLLLHIVFWLYTFASEEHAAVIFRDTFCF